MKKSQIFIFSGGNGIRNTGDDAMFEVFVDGLIKRDPEVIIATDSINEYWQPEQKNVKKIIYFAGHNLFWRLFALQEIKKSWAIYYRESLFNYLRLLFSSGTIAFSGSGGINDKFARNGLWRWGLFILIAKILGKKIVMSSQGIGPIEKKINRWLAKIILNRVDIIEVRDQINSKKLLLSLGVREQKIIESPDNAVILPVLNQVDANVLLGKIGLNKPYIIFNLHNWDQDQNKTSELLNSLNILFKSFNQSGYEVVLLGNKYFPEDDDRIYLKEMKNKLDRQLKIKLVDNVLSTRETKTVVKCSQGVLSSRYHLNVYGLSEGIISVPIVFDKYYEQKMNGLLKWYKRENTSLRFDFLQNYKYKDLCNLVTEFSDKNIRKQLFKTQIKVEKKKNKSLNKIYSFIFDN